jgi:hypothetical protein
MRHALVLLCVAACSKAAAPESPESKDSKGSNPSGAIKLPKGPGHTLECTDPEHHTHPCATVVVAPPQDSSVGASATARVSVTPKPGYHVNKDFPLELTVTPPAGVEVAKASQTQDDAAKLEEQEAAFEVKFTPKEAGDKKFAAVFKFAVCTDKTCDPKVDNVSWNVAVK